MASPELQILRAADICERFRISKTTLWRWWSSGLFPKPIRLGPNSVGWKVETVERFLDERATVGTGTDGER